MLSVFPFPLKLTWVSTAFLNQYFSLLKWQSLRLTPTELQEVLLSKQDLIRAAVLLQLFSFRTVHSMPVISLLPVSQ